MASPDTEKMIRMVEERTGYGVSTTISADLMSWGGMVSASERNPRHLVQVNSRYAQYGDYIVAVQCAMLLAKWPEGGEARGIPMFALRQRKIDEIARRVSRAKEVSAYPPPVRAEFSRTLVEGILNQLQSAPAELLGIETCYEECPGLRGMQAEAVRGSIRELTASLQPEIRANTPAEIFERNAAMNAAFCLGWAERTGEKACLLPFEVLGFLTKGRELFDASRDTSPATGSRYVHTVDRWAEILEMTGWYQWQFKGTERS